MKYNNRMRSVGTFFWLKNKGYQAYTGSLEDSVQDVGKEASHIV